MSDDLPTIENLRDRLSELVDEGFGDLPVQIVVVPTSTLDTIARACGGSLPGAPPALIIDLVCDGNPPVAMTSVVRLEHAKKDAAE